MNLILKCNRYLLVLFLCLQFACSYHKDPAPLEKEKVSLLNSYTKLGVEMFLKYDTLNRPVDIEYYDYATQTAKSGPVSYYSSGEVQKLGMGTFTYNEDGNVSSVANGYGLGNSTLEYDEAGHMLVQRTFYKDEEGNNYDHSRTFQYSADKLVQLDEYLKTSSEEGYVRYKMSYDAQGNMNKVEIFNSMDGVNYTPAYTVFFTFDNKVNPWKAIVKDQFNLPDFYVSGSFMLEQIAQFNFTAIFFPYQLNYLSPNNLVSMRMVDEKDNITTWNYSYTYNDDGLPVNVEVDIIYSYKEEHDERHYEFTYAEYDKVEPE